MQQPKLCFYALVAATATSLACVAETDGSSTTGLSWSPIDQSKTDYLNVHLDRVDEMHAELGNHMARIGFGLTDAQKAAYATAFWEREPTLEHIAAEHTSGNQLLHNVNEEAEAVHQDVVSYLNRDCTGDVDQPCLGELLTDPYGDRVSIVRKLMEALRALSRTRFAASIAPQFLWLTEYESPGMDRWRVVGFDGSVDLTWIHETMGFFIRTFYAEDIAKGTGESDVLRQIERIESRFGFHSESNPPVLIRALREQGDILAATWEQVVGEAAEQIEIVDDVARELREMRVRKLFAQNLKTQLETTVAGRNRLGDVIAVSATVGATWYALKDVHGTLANTEEGQEVLAAIHLLNDAVTLAGTARQGVGWLLRDTATYGKLAAEAGEGLSASLTEQLFFGAGAAYLGYLVELADTTATVLDGGNGFHWLSYLGTAVSIYGQFVATGYVGIGVFILGQVIRVVLLKWGDEREEANRIRDAIISTLREAIGFSEIQAQHLYHANTRAWAIMSGQISAYNMSRVRTSNSVEDIQGILELMPAAFSDVTDDRFGLGAGTYMAELLALVDATDRTRGQSLLEHLRNYARTYPAEYEADLTWASSKLLDPAVLSECNPDSTICQSTVLIRQLEDSYTCDFRFRQDFLLCLDHRVYLPIIF